MIVKYYELNQFKIALKAEKKELFSIVLLDGERSQIISGRDMDYDTATELYDMLLEDKIKDPIENIKLEVK